MAAPLKPVICLTHADFYVVEKPPGASMHAQHGATSFVQQCSAAFDEPLWPVHRLDQDTSGLLILARSAKAAAYFGELFAERQIDKYYLAIGTGKPTKKQGLIEGWMSPSRGGNWRLSRTPKTTPKEHHSRTQFFSFGLPTPGWRGYILKPLSGRTHQLRVHLKALGSPILGDSRYGTEPAERLFLHACALVFHYQQQLYQCQVWPAVPPWFPTTTSELTLSAPWQLSWPRV